MMEVDLRVKEHSKTETLDKDPKYRVRLEGTTKDLINVRVSMSSADATLQKIYPLNSVKTIKVGDAQKKLEGE